MELTFGFRFLHKTYVEKAEARENLLIFTNQAQRSSTPWQPQLPEPLRGRALVTASCVAERLRNPQEVLAIAELACHQSTLPGAPDPTLSTFGCGGGALPCAYFDCCFPDQGWDAIAHRYLHVQRVPSIMNGPSLFGGISGLAMILTLLSHEGTRYTKTRATLHQHLRDKIGTFSRLQEEGRGTSEAEYDLITGASGILAYLLTARSLAAYTTDRIIEENIQLLLNYILWLAGTNASHERRRWHVPAHFMFAEETRASYPDGYFNCGLAHGIPGPLGVLALAWLAGYRTPGLREAIRSLSDWLVQHAVHDRWGINWPDLIPLPLSFSADDWQKLPPTRAAWCYGAPGVARALWLAGRALHDLALQQTATEAIEAVLRRPTTELRIDSPTLCHGIAGLLAICLRFAHETTNPTVREHIPLLVTRLLDLFNPDFPLGFRDIERPNVLVDRTTWLTGAPGVAMVLLAAALPVEPTWDRFLLLS